MSLIRLNEDANCFKNPNSFMVDPVNVGQALSVSPRLRFGGGSGVDRPRSCRDGSPYSGRALSEAAGIASV